MIWLVLGVMAGWLGVAGFMFGREAERQKRDTAAVAEGAPEYRIRLFGGPFDGAYQHTSLQFGKAMVANGRISVTTGGIYVLTGTVALPDGGAVVQYEWVES